MKRALGDLFGDGVLLNGLVLNAFHKPEEIIEDLIVSNEPSISKILKSSFLDISISTDKNFLLSPLFIDLIVPPAGEL